jgi:hypothetical protein
VPDYNALRLTAERLISNFGSARTVTISRLVSLGYDPLTDVELTQPQSQTILGVIVDRGEELMTPPDDRTLHNQTAVLIPAIGMAWLPVPGDKIMLMGDPDPYAITDVGPKRPDGDLIYSKLLVQRAGA